MKTFEFQGKLYKESKELTCAGCAFEAKDFCCLVCLEAEGVFGGDCVRRKVIYILAEDKPTPADIARRIGEEAATYAEQAIANKIAEALEGM